MSNIKDTKEAEEKRQMEVLSSFLLDISDLEQLDPYISRVNIFDILGIVKTEIRHSNMLAWLFDPNESHGLGDLFVRRFINCVIRNNAGIYDPGEWFFIDHDSVSVHREMYRRSARNGKRSFLDIVLFFSDKRKDSDQKYLIAIENKIDSSEGEDQTTIYRELLEKEYGATHKHMYIYLTPSEEEPEDDAWATISYGPVQQILEEITEHYSDKMNETAGILVKNYLEIIRSNIMNDKLVELCNQIYSDHKEALDLIFEYKFDEDTENKLAIVRKAVRKLAADRPELGIVYEPKSDRNKTIIFYLDEFDRLLPGSKGVKYSFHWMASRDKGFILSLHPDKLTDAEKDRIKSSSLKTTKNWNGEHMRSEKMEFRKLDERIVSDDSDIAAVAGEIGKYVERILEKIK